MYPEGGPSQGSSERPFPPPNIAHQNYDALVASALEPLRRMDRVPRLLKYAAVLHALATPVAIVLYLVLWLVAPGPFGRGNTEWTREITDLVDPSQLIVVTQILFAVIAATLALIHGSHQPRWTIYGRDQPRWLAIWTIVIGGLTTAVSFLLAWGRYPLREVIGLMGTFGGLLSVVAGLEASQIRAPSTLGRDTSSATPAERKEPPPPPRSPS